jgi:hypothetical protein
MRIELVAGTTNVVRFPIERRARPTLALLREIAPDSRAVDQLVEAFGIDCCQYEVRPAADRAMAEHILNHVPPELGSARRAVLQSLLAPLVKQAVDACRKAYDAAATAAAARDFLARAQTEGGYWLAPLEARARLRTREAARLLVEAHLAAEEAEGAARAIRMALCGEEWRPFDVHAEAAALFGFDRLAG